MKAQHWRPLVACVVVALTCLAFMVHAIRTEALTGFINPGPARILSAPLLVHKVTDAPREAPVPAEAVAPSATDPAPVTTSEPAPAPGQGAKHVSGNGAPHVPAAQPAVQVAVHTTGHATGDAAHAASQVAQVAHVTQHVTHPTEQTRGHGLRPADHVDGPRRGGTAGPPEHADRHLEQGRGVPARHLVDGAIALLGRDDWHDHRYDGERGLRLGHDRPDAFSDLRGMRHGRGHAWGHGPGQGDGFGHSDDLRRPGDYASQHQHGSSSHGRWGQGRRGPGPWVH